MEWMCARCGALHRANTPPCNECGHGEFERPYERRGERAADRATATTQWVCAACGRSHPKHSPPCSRCGHMTLEQREVGVDPAELSSPSYLDLASPLQLVVAAVAVLAAVVVGLGLLGAVTLPGATAVGDGSGPAIPDAPGDPHAVDGTALADVERDYVASLNDERARRDARRVARSADLDEVATAYNRHWVRAQHGEGEVPIDDLRGHLARHCSGDVLLAPFQVAPGADDPADEPGESIADRALDQREEPATVSAAAIGVDVHAGTDGRLYVTQVLC